MSATKIVAAAVKYVTLVMTLPPPARHSDVIGAMSAAGFAPVQIATCMQGFLTNEGKFVDREGAAWIAFQADQFMPQRLPCELYSEDLW